MIDRTRGTAAALILIAILGAGRAQAESAKEEVESGKDRAEPVKKQWVWLQSQGVWGYGYQVQEGPHRGLWRIDPGSKRAPEPTQAPQASGDPYGFAQVINRYRAALGLPPVSYDPGLSHWAWMNNIRQSFRGIGHHVTPNCYQNCAWNAPDAETAASDWMNSPGHRENMLTPDATHFGIAYGPGPYWTLNLR